MYICIFPRNKTHALIFHFDAFRASVSADTLIGVDLSEGMLEAAVERGEWQQKKLNLVGWSILCRVVDFIGWPDGHNADFIGRFIVV